MAKKKKKTLPKNFEELIKTGDINALKAVFEESELNARGGYNKETALHFYNIPDEMARWLVEQGADINARNSYGRTPLYFQIANETVKLLLELGADIDAPDNSGCTPLHNAAGFFRVDNVRLLIERGANVHAQDNSGQTPLSYALMRCRNTDIACAAEVARLLFEAGAKTTPDMAKSIERIGKEFEFHREGFHPESVAEIEAGLSKLYSIFSVDAVAKRRVHDGVSAITVAAKTWREQHNELWEYLVPSEGAAQTVQGEVIRITGRISDELHRNGGANWDADYRKMLDALLAHFGRGNPLPQNELDEAAALAEIIRPEGDGDDEPDRLCELAVKWVLANQAPVALSAPGYKR